MSAMKPSIVLVVACAALSTLGGCGGSGDSSPAPPVATSPVAPAAPAAPSDPAPPPVAITLAPAYTQLSATVTFSTAYWLAWSGTGSAPIDGVTCGPTVNYHIHALLSIYKDGQRLALPGNIGRPSACDYEMHTHDGSGVIHIETDVAKTFTLGQFFAEWGQPLSASGIAGLPGTPTFYIIDNERISEFNGDPSTIDINAHREILVITGTPPAQVPRYDWNDSGL